jgi:hypothetical protein
MKFRVVKPLRFRPALAAAPAPRRSARVEAVAQEAVKPKPISVEEVRGVTVTTWPASSGKGVVVSEGIYTTYRYRERLAAAGGVWVPAEKAWHLPADSDARQILAPPPAPPKARPSWVCCEKAKIISHKNEHYSCSQHTMYYEDCVDPLGNPIKILYACSTRGGGCYTGT